MIHSTADNETCLVRIIVMTDPQLSPYSYKAHAVSLLSSQFSCVTFQTAIMHMTESERSITCMHTDTCMHTFRWLGSISLSWVAFSDVLKLIVLPWIISPWCFLCSSSMSVCISNSLYPLTTPELELHLWSMAAERAARKLFQWAQSCHLWTSKVGACVARDGFQWCHLACYNHYQLFCCALERWSPAALSLDSFDLLKGENAD